jgi:predicted GTPase
VIVWDGGNNDTSFLVADIYITVLDPHRAGHELHYHPGETNLRLATHVLINKVDTASAAAVARVRNNVKRINPDAVIMEAESPIRIADPAILRGRRVLAIEDGPTVTHGGMAFGAATLAARDAHAAALVDPRPFAVGELARALEKYPEVGPLLPAMGYSDQDVRDLEATLAAAARHGVEAVAVGTPIDLARIVDIPLPHTRVSYSLRMRVGSLVDTLAPVLHAARAVA